MTNRRQFLQIGIAASAWPLASQAAKAAAGVGAVCEAGSVALYKVVHDVRFPDSVEFAQRAASLGLATHSIEGDMTRFWYDDLHGRWRASPAAIAGLTAHGPMFCLERLAWDQRMRVVFRAEHRVVAGHIEHAVSGPVAMLDAAGGLPTHSWAAAMADLVARCPRGRAEIASVRWTTPHTGSLAPDGEPLYSWVIAPAKMT